MPLKMLIFAHLGTPGNAGHFSSGHSSFLLPLLLAPVLLDPQTRMPLRAGRPTWVGTGRGEAVYKARAFQSGRGEGAAEAPTG